jgi:glycosyltransferase involved in cell wall biosynthesis
LVSRVRPNVFLAYTIKPVIYGLIAATAARVPRRFALVTGLGYAFQEDTGRASLRWLMRKLYGAALTCSSKVFLQNPDDRELLRKRGVLRSVPSFIVNGSGVDLSHYEVAPLSSEPSFLLIARLLADKGIREYVEAARQVRLTHPSIQFVLVGWMDSNPNAISEAELAGWVAEGLIKFLGRLQDVRPAIRSSTIYVLPSYREGTPRTVLEAMAMGRPIITTDAPGCRETVIDGENGYLVRARSSSALAAAMLRFIDDPAVIPTMGARSRKIAEAKYDVHKINATMLFEMGIS